LEARATREVKLLEHFMRRRSRIPAGCAWVNYLRCHDGIGWSFGDEDARKMGIDSIGHREFLFWVLAVIYAPMGADL